MSDRHTASPPGGLLDDEALDRLQCLAAVAQEDVLGQRPLLVDELKPANAHALSGPSLWYYRAVRLLPLREVLGRRLAAAVEYEAGRRIAQQVLVGSLDELARLTRDIGLGRTVVVEQGADEFVLEEWDCSACSGLTGFGETVCTFEAGFLGRQLEQITGRSARTTEVVCWANGGDRCRFVSRLGPGPARMVQGLDGCCGDDPVEIIAALAGMAGQAVRLADELHQKNVMLSLWATTDPVTGLANRHRLMEKLHEEVERAQRYRTPLAVAMIDLDDFKRVNDTYGHEAGDAVLKRVGNDIAGNIRAVDLVARYGGEEFTVLLPQLPLCRAVGVMERVRVLVAAREEGPAVTMSVGVAAAPPAPPDLDALLSRADDALYQAKRLGKNRVVAGP